MEQLVSAAVIGVPDDEAGEAVMLFVTARPGAEVTPDEVLAVCRQHLPKHMVPHSVLVLDALPLNANGKIAKPRLREMAAARAASAEMRRERRPQSPGRSLAGDEQGESHDEPGQRAASGITADDLAKVSRTRVFFGHQSVGMNVLDGVPGIYAAHGMAAPPIEQDGIRPGQDGGFVGHAFIGENEKPLLKIQDFDAKMRSGIGEQVDVAMMKLCYVDVTSDTDVGALFAAYRETIAALERDFPKVTFVHVTVPLMTEPGCCRS